MPANTRDIKRRIRAIGNTKKITKAMELVAASKMRRAVQAVLATRMYANTAWSIVNELAQTVDRTKHPLLVEKEEVKTLGLLLIVSNRGLAGSFHRDLVEESASYIAKLKAVYPEMKTKVVLVGKKGRDIYAKHRHEITAEFEKSEVAHSVIDISPIARLVIDDYTKGQFDRVAVCYTDYLSSMKQEPHVMELLPIGVRDARLGAITKDEIKNGNHELPEFLFEPSADEVLDSMLYRLTELQIFQALLESNASEHSARMMSMRQASDAASDMIDDFTLLYNQARQASITTELADISGGRAALE